MRLLKSTVAVDRLLALDLSNTGFFLSHAANKKAPLAQGFFIGGQGGCTLDQQLQASTLSNHKYRPFETKRTIAALSNRNNNVAIVSVRAVPWALETRVPSPSTKLLLLAIAEHADENGCCWPSVKLLSKETALCERAVRKHNSEIRRLGLALVEPLIDGQGQTSNSYQLKLPWLEEQNEIAPPAPYAGTRKGRQGAPAYRARKGLHIVQALSKNRNQNRH